MKRIGFIIFFTFVALLLVIIGANVTRNHLKPSKPVASQPVSNPLSLSLDWTPNTNHTGIYVAIAKGFYKAAGIDLHILPYSSSVTPDVLVSSGKADLGISSTEGVVGNKALGQDVLSVAAILQHNTSSLAVLADSSIKTPRDLDGKIYGGFGAPSEEAVVNAIIKHDGGKGTVKNITLETGAMEALKAKRVDVVWIYDGWEGIQAKRDGVKLRIFPIIKYGIADYYTPVIISSTKTVGAKKELLNKFMSATKEGYEYAAVHPDEAAMLLIATAPKGTFPDKDLVIESQKYLSPYYVNEKGTWGLQTEKYWIDYPKFLLEANAISDAKGKPVTTVDFKSLYTNEFLE